jgi:phosphatidylglycerophosphate synthase
MSVIKKTREFRSNKLEKIANILIKLKFTPNILTTLSLISGLLSAYFLFNDYWCFLVFGILHLMFDAFDGVVARVSGPTEFGKYYDISTDSLISVLYLAKVSWFLQDYYAYLITGLFVIALLVYFTTKLQTEIIFIRTVSFIVLGIATFQGFPLMIELLTLGYLVVGATTFYSLAKQIQWFVKKLFSN